MNKKLVLGSLTLTLAVVLGIVYRAYMFEFVIQPLALILWTLRRIFLTVDQEVYWIILVVIALIASVRLIPEDRFSSYLPPDRNGPIRRNRILSWKEILRSGSGSKSGRTYLDKSLRHLLVRLDPQITGLPGGGSIPDRDSLPLEIKQLLQEESLQKESNAGSEMPPEPSSPAWLLSLLWYLDRPGRKKVEAVLSWLENRLETNHDSYRADHHD